MSKHTPGPWKKFDSAFPQFFVCVAGKDICKVSSGDVTLLEAEANANLIAAAPDLLEALEALLEDEEWMDGSGWVYVRNFDKADAARKVIAKARGQS